jgi:hypothetical protein
MKRKILFGLAIVTVVIIAMVNIKLGEISLIKGDLSLNEVEALTSGSVERECTTSSNVHPNKSGLSEHQICPTDGIMCPSTGIRGDLIDKSNVNKCFASE